jgi:hypothetical protein
MIGMPDFGPINTYSTFTQLNNYVGSNRNDQPWIRTGPANHVYVAFNDLGQFNPGNGRTASVNVSTDGGSNYATVRLDRVGAAVGQDDPAVRVAVNGSRVYAVFDRWTGTVENSANGSRFNSQLVVVRSDNGGADNFMAAFGPTGRRALPCRRADAQGQRADRCHRHLPPGGPPFYRQADRIGHKLRGPSRHRDREHSAAQRATGIVAAADRYR